MSSVKVPRLAKLERLDSVVSICQKIRGCLENRRDQVCQEITHYPAPIPACDVHFNRLLEERTKIFHELGRLDELRGDGQARKGDIALIDDFVRSSEAINDEDRHKLGAALKHVLAERDA